MKTAVLVLYVVAFILQMLGAYGVIQDVRASIGNMRRLKSDLAQAEATAEEHRRSIATIRDRPPPVRARPGDGVASGRDRRSRS